MWIYKRNEYPIHGHSPYNYAFNNPVFFIDPDGMMPGMPEIGSLAFHGAKDFSADFGEVAKEAEKGENSQSSNNAQSYSNFFHNVAVRAAQADGGECPEGDCDEKAKGANKANTVVGTVAEGVNRSATSHSKNYTARYGTKTTSAQEISKTTRTGMANTARRAKGVGYGTSFIGVGIAAYNFGTSDMSWGDYGQLGVSVTSSVLTISGPTAPIGIGMSFIDMGGGFDWFYNYLDGQEKIYETSGHVINPGIPGLPSFINLKK